MEKIIQLSAVRFKKTFLRYFLVYVLGTLGLTLAVLAVLTTGGILFLVHLVLGQQLVISILLGTVLGLVSLGLFIYLGTWFQLSQLLAITKPELKEVYDCFRESRPLILPFLGFSILQVLFLMGFLLFNVFLFLPFIIWSVWGIFAAYAFLDGKRGGLKPLWFSKARVSGHFFQVLLYIAVIYGALFLLGTVFGQINENLSFLNALLWFLGTPFIIGYSYEIYRSLPEPAEVKASTSGKVLSVLGWGLNFLVIGLALSSGMKSLADLIEKNKDLRMSKTLQKQLLKEIPGTRIN